MKMAMNSLLLLVIVLTACTCEECFTYTLSPSEIEEIQTAQATQNQQIPLSDDKPTLTCLVTVDSDDFDILRILYDDVRDVFNDSVSVSLVNSSSFIIDRYESLNLVDFPVCLVFDENHNLVLWNEQYLQAFNMNESDVFKGQSFLSLLELQKERGDFAGEPMDLVNKIMSHVRRGEAYLTDTVLGTGRFIKTAHSPTPVGGWIGTHEDVTDIRELEQRLAHESLHDVLTGVPNRRYFERELTERLLMAQRNMSPVALFTLDLDKFKVINDTYGHDVGDDVLLRAATIIRDVVGQDDFVARMGGDEFIVIVSGEHEIARLQRVAKSLCERLDQTARIKGNLCVCRASVGVAFSKDGQVSRHDLLTQSDIALYTAKQAGRGSYKVYDFASGQHQSNQLAS